MHEQATVNDDYITLTEAAKIAPGRPRRSRRKRAGRARLSEVFSKAWRSLVNERLTGIVSPPSSPVYGFFDPPGGGLPGGRGPGGTPPARKICGGPGGGSGTMNC